MKKLFVVVIIIAFASIFFAAPAFAATPGVNENEQAVLDYWHQKVGTFTLPVDALNNAELFFATNYDMTADQKDYIIAQTDRVIVIVKEENKSSLYDFTAADKSAIADIVFETAVKLHMHIQYNYTTNVLDIYDTDLNTILEHTAILKDTGESIMPIVLASLALLIVAGFETYFIRKNKITVSAK